MQPYYIHAAKKNITKHPIERHAYNTNKACQIPRTPLRYTTHMETTYQINSRKNTENKETNVYWLTSRKSKLSIENKLKIYKTIIKPIWTYGIPLWGTAAMSHINKMEAKILRTIVNGPWYVRNEDIRRDLGIPTVKEEISRYSEKYKSRIATHPNRLAAETYKTINMDRRLKRKHPADLIKDIT